MARVTTPKLPPRLQIDVLGPAPIVRPKPGEGCDYRQCGSIAQLREYMRPALQGGQDFGADWEATDLNTHVAAPVGLCVSTASKSGLYVPVGHHVDPQENLPMVEVMQVLKDADAVGAVSLWYSTLYDHELMQRRVGWIPKHWHDVIHGVFLVDSNVKQLGLKESSMRFIGIKMTELVELDTEWVKLSKKAQKLTPPLMPHQHSPYIVTPYGCADSDNTRQIWWHPSVQKAIAEQYHILAMEEQFNPVVREGNRHGVYLDTNILRALKVECEAKLAKLTPEIHRHFGEVFALSRKKYLATKVLALVPDMAERTEGGDPTVSVKVLDKYRHKHPVIPLLILHAQLTAQRDNYIEKLIRAHEYFMTKPWAHGRTRFNYNHIGVPTGRMKCGGSGRGVESFVKGTADVNVQSIPDAEKGPELPNIRNAFVAPPGWVVVAIDYSQIEVRIPTNLSKEPKWIATYQDPDGDIHLTNAQAITNVREPGVVVTKADKKRRGAAKAPLFALLYGGDEHTVARNAGIPLKEAKEILDAFVTGLPVLWQWIQGLKQYAVSMRKAVTFMGRIRPLTGYFGKEPPKPAYSERYDPNDIDPETGRPRPTPAWKKWKTWARMKAQGEREGINHPVQGGAADIFKTACIRIAQTTENFVKAGVWPASADSLLGPCAVVSPQVAWVHDEVVVYVREDWVTRIVPVYVEAMEFSISGWVVPLKAEPEVGSSRLYRQAQLDKAIKDNNVEEIAKWQAALDAVTGPNTGTNSSWGELVSYEKWVAAQKSEPILCAEVGAVAV